MSDVSDIRDRQPYATSTGGRGQRLFAHLTPIWRVTVKGQDVSARFAPRLVSLNITDNRDGEADEVEIVISDHDGAVELPETGDTMTVAIGWQLSPGSGPYRAPTQEEMGGFPLGLVDKGSYTIQAVEYSGAPDTITLRGRAANMLDELRTLKDRSWHGRFNRSSQHQVKLPILDTH